MNKQVTMVTGIVLIVGVVAGLWFWLESAKPKEEEISAVVQVIPPVNANLLSDTSMENLSQRKVYGEIPVQIESDYQNSDLFN